MSPALRGHVVTARITKNTHRALLQIKADTGQSLSDIVNDALRTHIRDTRTGQSPAEQGTNNKISGETPPKAG